MRSLSRPEWHDANGSHIWTQFILEHFGWLQNANMAHADFKEALFGDAATAASRVAVLVQVAAAAVLSVAYFLAHFARQLAVGATTLVCVRLAAGALRAK